jgi:hypothetical protein
MTPTPLRRLPVFAGKWQGRLFAAFIGTLLVTASAGRASSLSVNPGFDGGAAGWTLSSEPGRWSSQWRGEDATGDVTSGSVRINHLGDYPGTYPGAFQCVTVEEGTPLTFEARLRIPPGQAGTAEARVGVQWHDQDDCAHFSGGTIVLHHGVPGAWARKTGSRVAPAGTRSAQLQLDLYAETAGATLVGDYDDVVLLASDAPPPYGSWIETEELPGFEAQVRVTPPGGAPIEGAGESDCIAETICVHGALAGRPEVVVKVIGPRPNGHLWVQLVRFTPSQVEIWLRQQASGEINYYQLAAADPDAGILAGLEDRTAFAP